MQAVSTMIYEQAAQEQQAAGEAGAEAGTDEATDENVVDAEYEVVDEEKDN